MRAREEAAPRGVDVLETTLDDVWENLWTKAHFSMIFIEHFLG